tara:strand:+ start:194 stop:496 length:303 start_codon:yes stop_codon:yes gene_type:complete
MKNQHFDKSDFKQEKIGGRGPMLEQCQMRLKKWHVGIIAILLALVVKVPDVWAEVDEMAQLLIERLPEHATERYHHPDVSPNGDKVAFSVSTDSRNKSVI